MSGPYLLRHGDAWRVTGPTIAGRPAPEAHVARGSGRLALAFDSEEGTIRKHGEAAAVRAWSEAERERLRAAGFEDMATVLATVDFPVAQPVVEALNACLAMGTALGFLDRLATLDAADPALAALPTYPGP